jgi:glycosyltransferase involved in cell wall biosynthesis
VVLPCRNEAATVAGCVGKARAALARLGVAGEVVAVDNGSTDGSGALAAQAGARVVTEARVGYGYAVRRGLAEARARWIVVADADDSYDLTALDPFIGALERGADLVMGSRLHGTIRTGAMPWLHRWIGNPVLSWALRVLFFGRGVSDAHCGLRALTASAANRMRLRSGGMELASEMVIKAVLARMRIVEVPITLHQA